MILLYLVAAWIAGIFITSSTQSTVEMWLGLGAAGVVLAVFVRHNRAWRLSLICGVLFALGAARYAGATGPLPDNHVGRFVDSGYVTLEGIISSDNDVRDNHVKLHVEAQSLRQNGVTYAVQGMVLVQAPRYGFYEYGDRVSVSGQLLTPPEFDDFSYRDYLAQRGIHAMMPNARVDVLAHDQGSPWYAVMYAIKNRAQRSIDRLLPSPQAPLLSGILLGNEKGMASDIREAFNRTGTTHVIAISGANIIVVMRVLMGLLKPGLGTRRAGWITLGGVAVYTAFVGADPAVVRAAIMGSMVLLATQFGRKTYGLTSLAFSIWLMTAWSPLVLWDIGFQLSVAATAGLVLFGDILTGHLESLLKHGFSSDTARQITQWLAEPLTISLAAQITTTPLILLYFGRLSVVSLLANILIVAAQPYIMTIGWPATLVGMVWAPLGEPLAWVVWIPLSYTLAIVRNLSTFEWASVTVNFDSSYAWTYYSLLLGIALLIITHPDDRLSLWRRVRQHVSVAAVVGGLAVIGILVWAMALSQPDGKLHVWFLDVGDGHAVLIQTPRGAQVLVDGGPNPTRLRSTVGDELPFWDHDLDVLIITQPKTATINAVPALLDRYDVGLVLTNGQHSDNSTYNEVQEQWSRQGAESIPVTAGYRLDTGDGVTLTILHPQRTPDQETDDYETNSMVVQVSYGDSTFLLVPDINLEAEQAIMDAGWYIGSTVVELASNGSDSVNTDQFLRAASPQVTVVNVEAGNRFGLPAPEVTERLSQLGNITLYRTDQHGTVEFVSDGHTLQVFCDR